jgi:hypothetical protein
MSTDNLVAPMYHLSYRVCAHYIFGPGQRTAKSIQKILVDVLRQGPSANIVWVRGHIGIPGNERADGLAGQAAGKIAWSRIASLTHFKLRISERFREAKLNGTTTRNTTGRTKSHPQHQRSHARNSIARTAAQIRTGHWRLAIYFKRIKERANDYCRFCEGRAMTRSHVLLHVRAPG